MEEKILITPETWASLKSQMAQTILLNVFTNDKLNKRHPTLGTIYHYCSLNTLISIVENQTLYCTNVYFLNDKKEYNYGVDLILSRISKLKNDGINLDILNMLSEHINLIFKIERYVTCFSKNGDLLSQWRAYTKHGKGIAIGFESIYLDKTIDQFIHGKHIIYDIQHQIETIDELIRIIISFFEEYKDIFDWAEYGYEWLVTNAIIEFMNDIISGFKDPSFFEEQEYRFEYIIDGNMIKKYDDEIHFRATETQIIPYIKLISRFKQFQIDKQNGRFDDIAEDPIHSFMKLPIKEIIIGPSLDFEMTKMGIEELLKKCDYTGIKIIKSKIPYRL